MHTYTSHAQNRSIAKEGFFHRGVNFRLICLAQISSQSAINIPLTHEHVESKTVLFVLYIAADAKMVAVNYFHTCLHLF